MGLEGLAPAGPELKPSVFNHFVVFVLDFISVESILHGFSRFWKNPKIQDGGSRLPQFRHYDSIITQ